MDSTPTVWLSQEFDSHRDWHRFDLILNIANDDFLLIQPVVSDARRYLERLTIGVQNRVFPMGFNPYCD